MNNRADFLKHICLLYAADAKIDMTGPVIIKVKEDVPWLEKSVYAESFLLPSAYQAYAPQPNNSAVSVQGKAFKPSPLILYTGKTS